MKCIKTSESQLRVFFAIIFILFYLKTYFHSLYLLPNKRFLFLIMYLSLHVISFYIVRCLGIAK